MIKLKWNRKLLEYQAHTNGEIVRYNGHRVRSTWLSR
jgi:hypothetical protein